MSRWLNRIITFTCTMAIVALLSALAHGYAATESGPPNAAPIGDRVAQLYMPNRIQTRYRINDMWQLVYLEMPELPLENQYANLDTGEDADEDYTLIRRLIRYHIYVQNRPPLFRLDWKLTLADYLTVTDPNTGQPVPANERITYATYPGANVLDPHPLEGDRAAIASLSREQRDRLVDVLTTLFNPTYPAAVEAQAEFEAAADAPDVDRPDSGGRDLPRQPQPGDADLLIPGSSAR